MSPRICNREFEKDLTSLVDNMGSETLAKKAKFVLLQGR